MAITLTIELPDELAQKLIVRAKQKQVSPESIVLQSLSQTLNGDRLEIQNNKLQSTTALTPEQIHEMVFQEFKSQHFKKTFERLWELREIDKDLEEDDLESRLME